MQLIFLFCLVVFTSNVIQGITGFAGTLIAMPFIIMLVDIDTAKQVLNIMGILASCYIVYKDYCSISWKYYKNIIIFMMIGLFIGLYYYDKIPKDMLLLVFPVFVIFVAIRGFYILIKSPENQKTIGNLFGNILLLLAGIIHGLFVSGGPLLVIYATEKINDKKSFRATLSAAWLILNSLILIQSIISGKITQMQTKYTAIAIIPLIFGIVIGGILHSKLKQKTFMYISYVLLLISGISLLLK